MKVRIIFEYDENTDAWSASIPELNHISSWGKTQEEAFLHLKEAVALALEPISETFYTSNSQAITREVDLMDLLSA